MKIARINIEIYKSDLTIVIGSEDEFVKYITEDCKDLTDTEEFQDCEGRSVYYGEYNYIRLDKFPEDSKSISVLVHELLHTVFHIQQYYNLDYDENRFNEHLTYLIEYLTVQSLNKDNYGES